MSEPKVQLIDPQGNISVTGLSAVGVLTASSLDGTLNAGSATGLTGTPNLSVGVVTASTFTGQGDGHAANLTGTPQLNLGVTTSTGFVGDAVGKAAGLTGTPNLNVGLVTATGFVGDVKGAITGNVGGNLTGNIDGNVTGNVTGDVDGDVTGDVDGDVTGNVTGNIQGNVTGNVTGNLQGNVQGNVVGNLEGDVTGDVTGDIEGNVTGNVTGNLQGNVEGNVTGNLQGNVTGNVTGEVSGLAGALGINGINAWAGAGTSNLGVGVCTALQLYGDGSALTGTASSAYIAQNITATGANTTIDLSNGNVIYYDSNSNTTVAFSNPSVAEQITLIRDVDNDYTITWPDSVKWEDGSAPTLLNNDVSVAFQIFRFTTSDTGTTYNAWEEMIYDAAPQGGLFTWGNASDGLLGLNNTTYRSSPTQVGSNTNWSGLSRSINFSAPLFGVKADGTLWGWGSATNGELGQNYVSPLRLSSPVQISGTTWKNVDFGYQAAAAVKTDGTLWVWGKNDGGSSGVLGQNNLTNYSSPVQVGTETTWGTTMTTFGVSFRTMSNIKTDGTLWSWGYSDYGGSGHNNRTKYSSPRQVGTDTTWSSISQGYGAATAIKTDGTLWGWGRARYGELPFNNGSNPGNRSSPTQIGTDTNWSFVSQGNAFGAAIKTDGSLWMWGAGNEGRLGQNNETQRSSPIQIPGTTWSNVCATAQNMQALKTDGTFWVWGHAGSGRLGLNAPGAAHISSPTQIPGTWQIIGSSGNTGSAIK